MSIDIYTQYEIKTELPDFWQANWKNYENQYEWKVYLSSIAVCLFLRSINGKNENQDEKQDETFMFIHDQILDLGDWFISKGVKVPLVLVVYDPNFQEIWQERAGEQEWLRGQFSIQPVTTEDEALSRLKQVLDEKIPDIVEVQPKSDDLLAKEIEARLSDVKVKLKEEQRKLLQQIASEIINPGVVYRLDEWGKKLDADYQQLLEGKQ